MQLLPVLKRCRLKHTIFILIVPILVFVGLNASVYALFTPENIRHHLQQSIRHTHRNISFDSDIQRHLFPRPTLVLKNLNISEPDSNRTAISVRETKIGLSWKNLWSEHLSIEKWVVSGANLSLVRKENGTWNLQDLIDSPARTAVNRIIIENATVRLNIFQENLTLEQFNLNLKSADASGQKFKSSGIVNYPGFPVNWSSKGILTRTADGKPHIPEFYFTAKSRINGHDMTVDTGGTPSVQLIPDGLLAANLNLRADSSFRNLHLTTQIPALTIKNNNIKINTLNGTFTSDTHNAQWGGSFKLDKANLHPGIANIGNLEITGNRKTDRLQTNFSLHSPLVWTANGGISAPRLYLSTLQDTVNRLPNPRFISQLNGTLDIPDWHNWRAELNGTFDRQPLAAVFKYTGSTQPRLEAALALQKLSLAPYLDDFQRQDGKPFDFAAQIPGEIEAHVKINNVQIPGLQLDNVETYLSANKDHIAFSRFKAGLYGGQTEGGISIANTTPATYRLQQNARNVQIHPLLQDLFGFHSFSGNGDAVIDLTAKGSSRKQLIRTLQGTLSLNISKGAWLGIDMDNILKNGITGKAVGKTDAATPFHRFTLNSEISDGISRHIDTELFSDSLYVVSNGYTNLDTQELSEEVLIRNAVRPKNKPIPLKITGTVQNPSVTLDYARLTNGLNSRKEKQKILEDTLLEQWQWLKPKEK